MKNLFCLLSFLILFACNSPKETKAKIEFAVTEKFRTFSMPADMGHLDLYFQSMDDDYFFLFDYNSKKLLSYSIPNNELINTLQFEREGPNGIGDLMGIFVASPEEIFITNRSNVLFKFDSKGNLLQKTELNVNGLDEKGISVFTNILTFAKDGLYFPAVPAVFDWTTITPKELTEIPNLMRYDMISKAFTPVSYFPAEFVGDNLKKSIFPLLSLGPEQEPVINMNFRNIYRIESGEVVSSFAGHSGFPNDPPTSNSPNMFEDMPEIMRMINYTDIYTDLFYLKNQELMVRVAKFEDVPENYLDADSFLASKWGLVFLDSEFNKVGELDLTPDRYNGKYIFSDEAGIWISTDHPENPDLEEDFLRFQLIAVKK